MLKFLAPKLPQRTSTPSLSDLWLDKGQARISFNDPGVLRSAVGDASWIPTALVTNHLPPAPETPPDQELPNSSLCPPFHIHLREDETFRVISGRARFLLLDQERRNASEVGDNTCDGCTRCIVFPGEVITIHRGQIHTFRNASSDERLVLEFGFSLPGSHTASEVLNAKMKQFFMNTQLYRSDCTSQGIPRALPQVLLFNYYADVALLPNWLLALHQRFPWLRVFIEKNFASLLGRVMNFFGGVILGRLVFGLHSTYEEYYPSTQIPSAGTDAEKMSKSTKHD